MTLRAGQLVAALAVEPAQTVLYGQEPLLFAPVLLQPAGRVEEASAELA
jgi:hypothetical protein